MAPAFSANMDVATGMGAAAGLIPLASRSRGGLFSTFHLFSEAAIT
jgi:hypothetical protein